MRRRRLLPLAALIAGLALWAVPLAWAAPAADLTAAERVETVQIERYGLLGVGLIGCVVAIAARRRSPRLARPVNVVVATLTALLTIGTLMLHPYRPLNLQPTPDAPEYAGAARHLAAGDGYVATRYGNKALPPRYPPGYSLALAPFALVGKYPANVQLGARVYVILYVLVTLVAAWTIGGPLAATVAVALIGSSAFVARYSTLVMSDAFAAGLAVLVLVLVHRPSRLRLVVAGLISGALPVARLSSIVAVPSLMVGTSWRGRVLVAACASVGIGALAIHQWATFGSPLTTGYDYWLPEIRNFGLDYAVASKIGRDGTGMLADSLNGALLHWACPCPEDDPLVAFRSVVFFPLVLLGIFWIFTPPLTTIPGVLEVWRRRREPGPSFVLWLTVLTLLFQSVYFYQAARFMAAPATLLAVFSGVAVARWCANPDTRCRGNSP